MGGMRMDHSIERPEGDFMYMSKRLSHRVKMRCIQNHTPPMVSDTRVFPSMPFLLTICKLLQSSVHLVG